MPLPKLAVPTHEIKLHSLDKEIKFRPFLVKEEKLLLMALESGEEETMLSAIKTIINNCVHDEEEIDIDSLPLFDLELWFLHLRAKSVGEVVELLFKCKECEEDNEYKLNIDDVKLFIAKEHNNVIELTDKIKIEMKYPNVKQFASFDNEEQPTDKLFNLVRECISTIIDGDEVYEAKLQTKKELEEFILSLNQQQFKKIINFFDTMPKLRHMVTYKCKKCEQDNIQLIEGVENFFL